MNRRAPQPDHPEGGPLRSVLSAVDRGAVTVAELSRRTGLDRDVVRVAVAHLIRSGLLAPQTLSMGCADAGCGACPLAGGSHADRPGPACGA